MRPVFLLLFSLISFYLLSQQNSFFDYLEANEINKIKIETQFDYLISNKYKDTTFNGHVFWSDLQDEHKLDAKISIRGKYRRRVCSFPPIKINFSKKDLKKLNIPGEFDKYKLVTHCDTLSIYENYVNREFLIYEIFQELTEKSLKVYPIEIEYQFEETGENLVKKGFLIENEKELADRLGLTHYEGFLNKDDERLDQYQAYLTSLFLLMVSNDDYSFENNKNICLLQGEKIYPVPYDFDFSGFVNAHYAIPNPNIPRHGIRDHVVVYSYEDQELLNEIIELFLSKADRIEQIIEESELLDKSAKKDLDKFIGKFLKHLDKNRELPYHSVLSF